MQTTTTQPATTSAFAYSNASAKMLPLNCLMPKDRTLRSEFLSTSFGQMNVSFRATHIKLARSILLSELPFPFDFQWIHTKLPLFCTRDAKFSVSRRSYYCRRLEHWQRQRQLYYTQSLIEAPKFKRWQHTDNKSYALYSQRGIIMVQFSRTWSYESQPRASTRRAEFVGLTLELRVSKLSLAY